MLLTITGDATQQLEAWHGEVGHYLPLIKQVIEQTQRRVLQGEGVPADEKIFSLFESHTDNYRGQSRHPVRAQAQSQFREKRADS